MKYYFGDGLINTAINNLPIEVHLPGYNFCGPGTKVVKRLARGDRGINGLDEACKSHDIAYMHNKDLQTRHEADKVLARMAMTRFRSNDASLSEKIAALGVATAMMSKVKLGMGLNKVSAHKKNSCTKIFKKCSKVIKSIKIKLNSCTKSIDEFLKLLEEKDSNTDEKPIRSKFKSVSARVRNTKSPISTVVSTALTPQQQLIMNKLQQKQINGDRNSHDIVEYPLVKPKMIIPRKRKASFSEIAQNSDSESDKKIKLDDTIVEEVTTNTTLTPSRKRKLISDDNNNDSDDSPVEITPKRKKLSARKRKLIYK